MSFPTHVEFGSKRLASLCNALHFDAQRKADALSMFALLLSPWGRRSMGESPEFASDIGDDHTPFEFSVAFGGGDPELRLLFEPQGEQPTLKSQQQAGLALAEKIHRDFGVDLDRFHTIKDLFCPEDPQGPFSIWYAVCLQANKAPSFKLYLNPQVNGRARTSSVIEEALTRLGYPTAYAALSRIAGARGPDADEPKYFSLDLSPSLGARVKVYFRHHNVTADQLESAFSLAHSHRHGDVRTFCREITGGEGPFESKPVGSCFSYTENDRERPAQATLHLPISHYATNDLVARNKIAAYFERHLLPAQSYTDAINGFAERALTDGVGMQSYASLRREANEQPRVTIYLSPEGYRVPPPRNEPLAQRRPPRLSPTDLVAHYEANSMADHPLFCRMARDPVDMHRLYKLLANAQIGIVQPFSRRLAQVVAKIDDERIRSILAKQLNDELGNGQPDKAHALLFGALLAGLERWRPAGGMKDDMLAPGRELHAGLEAIYGDPDPYVGVGAAMLLEIYGKQVDIRTGQQLRRQKQVDAESLSWLVLHEELELEHASESLDIAKLVPMDPLKIESTWRGAERVAQVSWRFFDAVYDLCYGSLT